MSQGRERERGSFEMSGWEKMIREANSALEAVRPSEQENRYGVFSNSPYIISYRKLSDKDFDKTAFSQRSIEIHDDRSHSSSKSSTSLKYGGVFQKSCHMLILCV